MGNTVATCSDVTLFNNIPLVASAIPSIMEPNSVTVMTQPRHTLMTLMLTLSNDSNVRCELLDWPSCRSVESDAVYLIFHIASTSNKKQSNDDDSSLNVSNNMGIFQSARVHIDSKYLMKAFGSYTSGSPSQSFRKRHMNDNCSYECGVDCVGVLECGLHVWVGKAAHPLLVATSLTTAFEIHKVLDSATEQQFEVIRKTRRVLSTTEINYFNESQSMNNGDGNTDSIVFLQKLLSSKKNVLDSSVLKVFIEAPERKNVIESSKTFQMTPSLYHVLQGSHSYGSQTNRIAIGSDAVITNKKRRQEVLDEYHVEENDSASPLDIDQSNERDINENMNFPNKKIGMGLSMPSFELPLSSISSKPKDESEEDKKAAKLALHIGEIGRIRPYLCVSGEPPARDLVMMRRFGITGIINNAPGVVPCLFQNDFEYLSFDLADGSGQDIRCVFYDAIDFIDRHRQRGGCVLSHCHQGVSRSTTLVIAYIMRKEGLSFEASLADVRNGRPVASPNGVFVAQLLEWEKHCRGNDIIIPRVFFVGPYSALTNSANQRAVRLALRGEHKTIGTNQCIVIRTQHSFYLWCGPLCSLSDVTIAKKWIDACQRIDGPDAPLKCLSPDDDTNGFLEAVAITGAVFPPDIGTCDEIITRSDGASNHRQEPSKPTSYFESLSRSTDGAPPLLRRIPMSEVVDEEKLSSNRDCQVDPVEPPVKSAISNDNNDVLSEFAADLYEFPDWVHLAMFDTDDLVPSAFYILIPRVLKSKSVNEGYRPPIFAWIGSESLTGASDDEIAEEAISMALDCADILDMKDINERDIALEFDGRESDEFFDYFTNG